MYITRHAPICILHHHIGTEGPCERGLNLTSSLELFAARIQRLSQDYEFIDLDTLLSGRPPRRAMLLTFDDAFRSVVTAAREVLKPLGAPSVFFVNPRMVDEGRCSVDGALAGLASQESLAAACALVGAPERGGVGELIQHDLSKLRPAQREAVRAEALARLGGLESAPMLRPEDFAELRECGVEIGNHTLSHSHGRALVAEDIQTEIVESKARLEALCGRSIRSFSLPYGAENDLTPPMLAALRETGHEAIFLVHARSNRFRPAPDIYYRHSFSNQPPGSGFMEFKVKALLRTAKAVLS